nr:hypothetical protein [Tanacetum cinerariifolium]
RPTGARRGPELRRAGPSRAAGHRGARGAPGRRAARRGGAGSGRRPHRAGHHGVCPHCGWASHCVGYQRAAAGFLPRKA